MKFFLLLSLFLLINNLLLPFNLPVNNFIITQYGNSPPAGLFQIKPSAITGSRIKDIIEQRNGKILLLDVWATWCLPCKEEFPTLIKLQDYYKNKDVEIIAISVDYPDELQTKVIPMLNSLNVNFKTYVADLSNDTELINLLNPQWNGAIPAAFIYDRNGKQAVFLQGEKSFNDFKSAIEKAGVPGIK